MPFELAATAAAVRAKASAASATAASTGAPATEAAASAASWSALTVHGLATGLVLAGGLSGAFSGCGAVSRLLGTSPKPAAAEASTSAATKAAASGCSGRPVLASSCRVFCASGRCFVSRRSEPKASAAPSTAAAAFAEASTSAAFAALAEASAPAPKASAASEAAAAAAALAAFASGCSVIAGSGWPLAKAAPLLAPTAGTATSEASGRSLLLALGGSSRFAATGLLAKARDCAAAILLPSPLPSRLFCSRLITSDLNTLGLAHLL